MRRRIVCYYQTILLSFCTLKSALCMFSSLAASSGLRSNYSQRCINFCLRFSHAVESGPQLNNLKKVIEVEKLHSAGLKNVLHGKTSQIICFLYPLGTLALITCT